MYTTKNFQEAQAQAQSQGKPLWKSDDGWYAVADSFEFADYDDAEQWTEIE